MNILTLYFVKTIIISLIAAFVLLKDWKKSVSKATLKKIFKKKKLNYDKLKKNILILKRLFILLCIVGICYLNIDIYKDYIYRDFEEGEGVVTAIESNRNRGFVTRGISIDFNSYELPNDFEDLIEKGKKYEFVNTKRSGLILEIREIK
ncbi:hypothetical protein SH2C18_03910 [Clostridium sediminicola]|uniref:hypothetical protein n=1 Tax=Clostridium sediminicola TaxID=3114879 RepID=UPI0031F1DBA5